MNPPLTRSQLLLPFGFLLTIILFSIGLAMGPWLKMHPELAIGITYDLTLVAPLVYLLLIRKKRIPNITVVPVFILGVVIATLILPAGFQNHLDIVKTFLLPVVELTVVSIIIYKTIQIRKHFKSKQSGQADFLEQLRNTTEEVLGQSKVARIFTTEISMFYYAFFAWRGKKRNERQFTVYRASGITAVLGILIFILVIETVALHLLLGQWSTLAAWILTGLGIYTSLQLIAHLKALRHRFVEFGTDKLILRNGLFGDAVIPLDQIEGVEQIRKPITDSNRKVEYLSLLKELEKPNVALYFNQPITIERPYGIRQKCDTLMVSVDDLIQFIEQFQKTKKEVK